MSCVAVWKMRSHFFIQIKSAQVRDEWHTRDLKLKNKGSFMIQHFKQHHPNTQENEIRNKVQMELENVDNKPLNRILREAIRIRDTLEGETTNIKWKNPITGKEELNKANVKLINTKREFNMPVLSKGKMTKLTEEMEN